MQSLDNNLFHHKVFEVMANQEKEMPQGKHYVLKSDGEPVGGIMAKPKEYGHIPNHCPRRTVKAAQ